MRAISLFCLWVVLLDSPAAQAQTPDPLTDPVAKGAWLFAGNCERCHGDYGEARFGTDLAAKELKAAIGGSARQGCRVNWSIAKGGPLSGADIGALVSYIEAWETAGGPPVLPPLPPQPTRTPVPTATADLAAPVATPLPAPVPLDPALVAALAGDPVAEGAWLYTRNCQRCHLDYATARMGQTLDAEVVKRTIREGKIGTAMPTFSFVLGGELKSAQIEAVMAYIEAWETAGAEPPLPAVVRDAVRSAAAESQAAFAALDPRARGELLFDVHCVSCHGGAGVGGSAPALASHRLGMRPTATLREVIATGVPGTEMVAWSQANGGLFDDRALDDVASLVQGWRIAAQPTPTPVLVRAALPTQPGPWVLPFGIITLVSFAMALMLIATGYWKG